nr:MAG TPA: hypothetical protein [Caudoviricetes sp.]
MPGVAFRPACPESAIRFSRCGAARPYCRGARPENSSRPMPKNSASARAFSKLMPLLPRS